MVGDKSSVPRNSRTSLTPDGQDETPTGESAVNSVNVGVSQTGAVGRTGWGMSRPSSPGHSPGVSPSHRQKPTDPASPSNSPTPVKRPSLKEEKPTTRAPEERREKMTSKEEKQLPTVPSHGMHQQHAPLTASAKQPSGGQLLKQRPATPPLRSPTRASSLAAVLKVPETPSKPKRLWMSSPRIPLVEGKYLQVSATEWHNPEIGKVHHDGTRWSVGIYPAQPSLSSSPLGRATHDGERQNVSRTSSGIQSSKDSLSVAFTSAPCEAAMLPHKVKDWQMIMSADGATQCADGDIRITNTPGKYFFWEQEIAGIGDPQEFETALEAGIGELEEHIYISHKLAYIDNVGSMYRLPRSNPPGSSSGTTAPAQPPDASTAPVKWFDIGEFLRYLYSPEGLGWLDGRPAVLAAMIYVDRIRARGRIVSRRSVHRLLTAAVLVGHEYFTKVMQDAGDCNIEPAPINELCEMTYLSPEQMEPLTTRFKSMLEFENKVLETDVTAYCGALRGGIELTQTLKDEAKKERVPGQQGLSSRRDGMDTIRQWVDDSMVSCHRNLQLPSSDTTGLRTLAKRSAPVNHRLGGASSRVALVVLQKVKNANVSRYAKVG